MAAVQRILLDSSLARRHALVVIPTHRPGGAAARAAVFAGGLRRLAAFCRGPRPRLAHVHMTVRGSMHRKAVSVALARSLGCPVLLHVHSGPGDLAAFHARLGPLRRAVFRGALRRADRVLAVSAASARELRERYGAHEVEVLPNPFPAAPPGARPADPAAPGAAHVLYLGGFANPVKGGSVLLEALPALLRAWPDAPVTLAGPGEPPPALAALDGRVRWRGWLDEAAKAQALDDADVFVLPSTSEGLPVALLEAMAHGKAAVATAVGGVPDVLADGREGVVVPPGDPGALADALVRVVGDPGAARDAGRAARERAAGAGPEQAAARLDALYCELAR
jgi:glycosyltransferase involved in cell wall biosynthesis